MNYGYVKVTAAVPRIKIADRKFNAGQIGKETVIADGKGVQIIVFPELCITKYIYGDFFVQQFLLEETEMGLVQTLNNTCQMDIISILDMPVSLNGMSLNTVVVMREGKILGIIPKTYLPNYKELYEKYWPASVCEVSETTARLCGQVVSMGRNLLFGAADATFGVGIYEDLRTPIPPSSSLVLQGAEILLNLSADNEGIGKHACFRSPISQQPARYVAGCVFSSYGFGESITDVVFTGSGLIYENGTLSAGSGCFPFEGRLVVSEIDVEHVRTGRRVNMTLTVCHANCAPEILMRTFTEHVNSGDLNLICTFEPHLFVPQGSVLDKRYEEVFSIQVSGLAQRLVHTNAKSAVVDMSDGLDSTLALLACAKTFDKLGWDRKGIIGVIMPGFGAIDRAYTNAVNLMTSLGATMREVCIKDAYVQHFKDIDHDMNMHDVVYENSQARERTQILMDIASQTWGVVVGTDDLSELVLGWATYSSDRMSMCGVSSSISETLVKHLVKWVAENNMDEVSRATLSDIADAPISSELVPADENGDIRQITGDLVGPYELHDFLLYYFLRHGFRPSKISFLAAHTFKDIYDEETIRKWLQVSCRHFFNQQFKRSCLPNGPKVGSISISPRGGWHMLSNISAEMQLGEVETL